MSPESQTRLELFNELPIGKDGGLRLLEKLGMNVPSFFVIKAHETEEALTVYSQKPDTYWAVRSAANVEDGKDNSYAGQFRTLLNVSGLDIPKAVMAVRSSVNSASVSAYLERKGIANNIISMDVIVQEFIEPDKAGVWMGTELDSGILEWVNGRGENLVNGSITPKAEHLSGVSSPGADRLRDDSGVSVAETCKQIQGELGYPVDIEFCIKDDVVWYLQLRPVTVDMKEYLEADCNIQLGGLLGEIASRGIVSGPAFRYDLYSSDWAPDSILVTEATGTEDMHAIVTSLGLVTRTGGLLSHAAVIARELEIPCIIGIDIDKIAHNNRVTVDAERGEVRLDGMGQ